MSAADAADICSEIASGLKADERTAAHAGTWDGLITRGDSISATRRAHRRAAGEARARERVIDTRWDQNDAAFGRAALDAANGKRAAAPYATFYGDAPPSTVNSFGIDREVEFGRGVISLLATDAGAVLRDPWHARWTAHNEALAVASRAKKDAVLAEAPPSANESLYIEDVNAEIDRLEGQLLTRFPGDRATVDAFLAPTRVRAAKKQSAANHEGD